MNPAAGAAGPVWGIVVAGGSGRRFGGAKQWEHLNGRSLAATAVAACRTACDGVCVVVPDSAAVPADLDVDHVVSGGSTRAASVRNGLAEIPAEATVVVVHDAVRPLAPQAVFQRVIDAVRNGAAGAVPAVAVSDTLKRVDHDGSVLQTIERDGVVAVQTPQAFDAGWLRRAHDAGGEATDDAALVEAAGGRVVTVEGDPTNVKVTTAADLERMRQVDGRRPALRIGHGFDVHRWAEESRPLVLGGVTLPGERGLAGHSDADVVCHALADAILGAAGLGDLGAHFPDNDPRWAGARSTELLRQTVELAAAASWAPVSADLTVVAEAPRLSPFVPQITATLGDILGAPISVKATTAEGLGTLGRGEGVAVWAVTLLAGA